MFDGFGAALVTMAVLIALVAAAIGFLLGWVLT